MHFPRSFYLPRFAVFLFCAAIILSAAEAHAIRFSLGLAGQITPVVIDQDVRFEFGSGTRLGLRPVLEVEALPWLAFDTYAPFNLYRTDATGPASSGGESIFGLGVSARLRSLSEDKIEVLKYGRLRGGFATQAGRAGPYLGLALGYARTDIATARSWFAEIEVGHVAIGERGGLAPLDRWLMGVSIGVTFRLGGERWAL